MEVDGFKEESGIYERKKKKVFLFFFFFIFFMTTRGRREQLRKSIMEIRSNLV